MDSYSALLPYMGVRGDVTFQNDAEDKSKVFRCPSDRWLDSGGGQGRTAIESSTTSSNRPDGPYFPISYGVNVDIAAISDSRQAKDDSA